MHNLEIDCLNTIRFDKKYVNLLFRIFNFTYTRILISFICPSFVFRHKFCILLFFSCAYLSSFYLSDKNFLYTYSWELFNLFTVSLNRILTKKRPSLSRIVFHTKYSIVIAMFNIWKCVMFLIVSFAILVFFVSIPNT